MEIDALCIVCNWYSGIGAAYYGLGGLGVAGGFFGGSGSGDDSGGGSGQDDSGVDQTSPDDGTREARDNLVRERNRLIQNGGWNNQTMREDWQNKWRGPREDSPFHQHMLRLTDSIQKWAEGMVGTDVKGTAPSSSKA